MDDPWDGQRLGPRQWIRDQRRYGCRDSESRPSTDVRRPDHASWPTIPTYPHSGPAPPSVFAVHVDDTSFSMKQVPPPWHPCAGRPRLFRCLSAMLTATCKHHTLSVEAPGIGSACPAQAYARSAASSPTRPGYTHTPRLRMLDPPGIAPPPANCAALPSRDRHPARQVGRQPRVQKARQRPAR
ncbi:hypothetical protein B0H10DRAFT_1991181, partial [Mycena sp. CBHHK59/15]